MQCMIWSVHQQTATTGLYLYMSVCVCVCVRGALPMQLVDGNYYFAFYARTFDLLFQLRFMALIIVAISVNKKV